MATLLRPAFFCFACKLCSCFFSSKHTFFFYSTCPGCMHSSLEKFSPGGTHGNSWWGCAARFSLFQTNNVIFLTRFQTRPLKSIPVFRSNLYAEIMLSLLSLVREQTRNSSTSFQYCSFFLTHLELKR